MQKGSQRNILSNAQQFYRTYFVWQHTLNCCYRHTRNASRSATTRKTSPNISAASKYCTLILRTRNPFPDECALGRSKLWRMSNFRTLKYSTPTLRINSNQVHKRGAIPILQPTPSIIKSLMSRIVHPIAIVSSQFVDDLKRSSILEDDGLKYSRLCAMTVSSINTVTLEPQPVISFNIRRPSRTHDAIFQNGKFNVQFLTASIAGKYMGEAFSQGDAAKGFRMLDRAGISWSWSSTESNGPHINGDGVLASLKCQLLVNKSVEVGDHTVIIAKIDNISPGPKQVESENISFSGQPGLTYVMRDFKGLGESIPDTSNDHKTSQI